MKARAVAAFGMIVLLLVAARCSGSGGAADGTIDPWTKTDDGGAVSVEVTWVKPERLAADEKLRAAAGGYRADDVVVLHMKLNTHSKDLSDYDLGALATLDDGGTAQQPLGWSTIADDSHHTEAVLAFERPDAPAMTLVMADIGGVPERRLTWQLRD